MRGQLETPPGESFHAAAQGRQVVAVIERKPAAKLSTRLRATVSVGFAFHPLLPWFCRAGGGVCDLRDADHWLRRALEATQPAAAAAVAQRVGTAAAARMAYLASRFDAPEVAAAVAATLPGRARTSIGSADAPVVARDASLGVVDRLGVATLR